MEQYQFQNNLNILGSCPFTVAGIRDPAAKNVFSLLDHQAGSFYDEGNIPCI